MSKLCVTLMGLKVINAVIALMWDLGQCGLNVGAGADDGYVV